MVFIYSSSGELSAYTFQDNKNKYQAKQLDDKTTDTERTISPENSVVFMPAFNTSLACWSVVSASL